MNILNIYIDNGYYVMEDKELGYTHSFDEEERLKLIEDLKKIGRKKTEKPFLGHDLEIKKLWDSPQQHIRILVLFAKAQEIIFENKEQLSSFIKRNTRAASLLKGYSLFRVLEVMRYLKKQDFKWTLETVGKYIDIDLSKIKNFEDKKSNTLGEFII